MFDVIYNDIVEYARSEPTYASTYPIKLGYQVVIVQWAAMDTVFRGTWFLLRDITQEIVAQGDVAMAIPGSMIDGPTGSLYQQAMEAVEAEMEIESWLVDET